MRKSYHLLLITITLLIIHPAGVQARRAADSLPAKITEAEFRSLDGSVPIKLSNYKGKVVVLALLASWCPVCNSVVKELNEINNEFKSRGVEVVGLTMPSSTTDAEWVGGFAGGSKINFKLGWLSQEAIDHWLMKMKTVPQFLVVNGNGKIIKRFPGWSDSVPPALRKEVEQALVKASSSR